MSQESIDKLAMAISKEIPTSSIGPFLKKFEVSASGDGCGSGCGSGCCGAACLVSPGDLGSVDTYGYLGLTSADLKEIGKTKMAELKNAIRKNITAGVGLM